MKKKLKNIIILGGSGRIGSAISKYLELKGYDVYVIDKFKNKYKKFQNARATAAKDALGNIGVASSLIANPTEDEARAFVAAIKGQDLSGEVGAMLPAKSDYK